jgi:mRNA interferase MazF
LIYRNHAPVVISSDRLNRSRARLAVVVPVTRTMRGLPTHIELAPGPTGLLEVSYAKVEDIKSVSWDRLERRLGVVTDDRVAHITEVAKRLLEP